MKQFIYIIFTLAAFSLSIFPQDTEIKKAEKEISICPVKLLVGAASFRFNYRYLVETDDKGSAVKTTQLGKDDFPKFIKDEDFIPCIESWKLNPLENYFVSIYVGTIFTAKYKNYISISNKSETIKLIIPDTSIKLIVEDEKK